MRNLEKKNFFRESQCHLDVFYEKPLSLLNEMERNGGAAPQKQILWIRFRSLLGISRMQRNRSTCCYI